MAIWRFDTEPDPEFPLYTRGNIGEVFPDVVSPLTFSLNMRTIERGWRRLWTEGHILDPTDREFRVLGAFGGYSYLNLSIMRRAADLAPGTSPEEIDHQFFAVGIELPPYEPPNEPGYEERKKRVGAWIESLLLNPPVAAVEADRKMALEIRRIAREKRKDAGDAALVSEMRQLAQRLEVLFYDHITTSGMSSVAFGALQQGLRERLGEGGDELARRALSGLGDVDSAEPAHRVAEIAGLGGAQYEQAFSKFLEDCGFRGANEWELATPSWEMVPEVVRQMVGGAKGAAPKPQAATLRGEAVSEIAQKIGDGWPELPFWITIGQWYVAARERTKTNCIVLVNEQRLNAATLAGRLVERGTLGSPEEIFLMTIDELEATVHEEAVPSDLSERAKLIDELKGRVAPLVVLGKVPPLKEWGLKTDSPTPSGDSGELSGVAGSPGVASGKVRVILDPYASTPLSAGEILVAPITDPGWTPMFVPAAAVVVEVGGELSHAVIVARELGIPAVVAASGACSILKDGDLVEVDGSHGRVRILERA